MHIYFLFCSTLSENTVAFLARLSSRSALLFSFCCQIQKDHMIAGCMAFTHWQPSPRGDISWGGKTIILYCTSHLKWKLMLTFLYYVCLLNVQDSYWVTPYWGKPHTDLGLKLIFLLKILQILFWKRAIFMTGKRTVFLSTHLSFSKYSFAVAFTLQSRIMSKRTKTWTCAVSFYCCQ